MRAAPNLIIPTKIKQPPVRQDLVLRQGLHERLTAGLEQRLTLVLVPAGYGKSTLVNTWHMYNTHFAAGMWPLDPTIFTGKISHARMLEEHPLEYQRLPSAGPTDPAGQSNTPAERGSR